MSSTLPISPKVLESSIKDILKDADLSSLSSKKVRKILEEKFKTDLTDQKRIIDDTLMKLIDAEEKTENNADSENGANGENNDSDEDPSDKDNAFHKQSASNSKRSRDETNGGSPAKRKATSGTNSKIEPPPTDSSDDELSDEALARKLQQEELGVRRRSAKVERKQKKVTGDKAPRRKGTSLYSRECVLSEELSAVMGTNKMARKDVVSRMWQIFKERNLIDPKQRQYVICDEQLEKVFKARKFKAFGMMKFLKHHMKDPKLVQQS